MPPEPGIEAVGGQGSPVKRLRAPRLHGLGPIVGLVFLCVAGALLNSDFASLDNAMNVLTRTAFIGIIAVGMCFVIISGGIDLSVGSMAALIAGGVIPLMNALGAHRVAPWLPGLARPPLPGAPGTILRLGDRAPATRGAHH